MLSHIIHSRPSSSDSYGDVSKAHRETPFAHAANSTINLAPGRSSMTEVVKETFQQPVSQPLDGAQTTLHTAESFRAAKLEDVFRVTLPALGATENDIKVLRTALGQATSNIARINVETILLGMHFNTSQETSLSKKDLSDLVNLVGKYKLGHFTPLECNTKNAVDFKTFQLIRERVAAQTDTNAYLKEMAGHIHSYCSERHDMQETEQRLTARFNNLSAVHETTHGVVNADNIANRLWAIDQIVHLVNDHEQNADQPDCAPPLNSPPLPASSPGLTPAANGPVNYYINNSVDNSVHYNNCDFSKHVSKVRNVSKNTDTAAESGAEHPSIVNRITINQHHDIRPDVKVATSSFGQGTQENITEQINVVRPANSNGPSSEELKTPDPATEPASRSKGEEPPVSGSSVNISRTKPQPATATLTPARLERPFVGGPGSAQGRYSQLSPEPRVVNPFDQFSGGFAGGMTPPVPVIEPIHRFTTSSAHPKRAVSVDVLRANSEKGGEARPPYIGGPGSASARYSQLSPLTDKARLSWPSPLPKTPAMAGVNVSESGPQPQPVVNPPPAAAKPQHLKRSDKYTGNKWTVTQPDPYIGSPGSSQALKGTGISGWKK